MLIIGLCLCWCSCVIETKTSSFWWLRKETTWSEIPRLSLFGRQFCKNYDIYLYLQMTTVNTNCKGRTLHHHKCSNFPRINSCLSLETKKGGLWIITWVQNFKWIILCIIRKKRRALDHHMCSKSCRWCSLDQGSRSSLLFYHSFRILHGGENHTIGWPCSQTEESST